MDSLISAWAERSALKKAKPSLTGHKWRERGRPLVFALPLITSACAVLNPAPYEPLGFSPAATKGEPPTLSTKSCGGPAASGTDGPSLNFASFGDAAVKLCALGAGFALERNTVMQEKLAFDLPAIGLGLATAANGAFNGAKDLTLALGIGSAGVAGTSLYFSPSTRVTAYNNASDALLCAVPIAQAMGEINHDSVDTQSTIITNDIAAATTLIENGPGKNLTQDQLKDLLTARDAATKAQSDLASASALLTSGPSELQSYAMKVLRDTTTTVVTGVQNLGSALSTIKGSSGAGASNSGTTPKLATPKGIHPQTKAPTADDVIAKLNQDATQAEAAAKQVNDTWSGLADCPAV